VNPGDTLVAGDRVLHAQQAAEEGRRPRERELRSRSRRVDRGRSWLSAERRRNADLGRKTLSPFGLPAAGGHLLR
jgi:hypothetical protein